MTRFFLPSALSFVLAGVIATPAHAAPSKPSAFTQCAVCHKVDDSGKHGIGPNLSGVYGEKAGTKAGFNFSPAMKSWGKKLDDAALNAFLENPRKSVPGTKMAFAGLKDPAKRKAIIDWLKVQK
ncbi:c-type cytochrome [Rhizorhapis suberifaciens]|uniref:Cytochrome c2 n=1 Tax=Rhizorhapis suberifaciens TaxID=13656 RepID=A0A840HX78_9SPHN|nr:c-type cytochrome [Rhizorhapis suberifaciens]MBB4642169.1 cytochrome c2 [Rhizorhapis suberifaciens]